MAFITGTAANAEDLFARLRTFLTSHPDLLDPAGDGSDPSQAWTELKYQAGTPGGGSTATPYELYLRGPGLSASDSIYVNMQLFNDTAAGSDAWSIRFRGATQFSAAQQFTNQPGSSTNECVQPFYNQSMPYWFFANGRRFIIVAQVTNSVYTSSYCGFILPYAPLNTITEYPYPLLISAGMGRIGRRFSETSRTEHTSFWSPCYASNQGSAMLYDQTNAWQRFANVASNGVTNPNVTSSTPGSSNNALVSPYNWNTTSTNNGFRVDRQQLTVDSQYVLRDIEFLRPFNAKTVDLDLAAFYGILDGVKWVSGIGQSAQNTVTLGADTYRVFQEAGNTAVESFAAILEG
jgi:hypothetical protein